MTLNSYNESELPTRLELSGAESKRFGLPIARLQVAGEIDGKRVLELFIESEADMLIFRYPTRNFLLAASLTQSELVVLHADTLVYFQKILSPKRIKPGEQVPLATLEDNELSHQRVVPGESLDADLLERFIRKTFVDYPNHYRANPILDARACEDGYAEWALRTHAKEPSSTIGIYDHDGQVLALAVTDVSDSRGEFLLTSVSSKARGQGLLGKLMMTGEQYFADRKATTAVISTQIWNHTALRSWARSGYELHNTFNTLHLMRGEARSRFLNMTE